MRNDSNIFDVGYVTKELEKNPFTNVSKIVSDAVEDAILTMRLKPGEKLIISNIASQLGISTTPVREAIDRLAEKGLIKIELNDTGKQSIYRVFKITMPEVEDLFFVRKAIEPASAYYCAEHPWLIDLEKLEDLARKFYSGYVLYDKTRDKSLLIKTTKLDREFHKLIVNATNSKVLIETYKSIEKKLTYLTAVTGNEVSDYSVKNLVKIGHQHVAISNAIKNGFTGEAKLLMNEHLNFCMNINRKSFD
ncbi:MAG: hypothetical protein DBX38_04530 [Eubacteriales Family XIII. Incertae Sedis bacterium]|nr:MAG: hypothetical protein DBX38_04530 [Clostridiales Family XIII bacterium]